MMIVDIEEQISLLEIIKGILPSEIERFSRKYINRHVYFKLRDIAYYYLETYYTFPITKYERDNLLQILARKVSRFIPKLMKEGLIEKYNQKTYKRVDHKNVRSTEAKLEIPKGYTISDYRKENLTGIILMKLEFKDGSFKNPKFL